MGSGSVQGTAKNSTKDNLKVLPKNRMADAVEEKYCMEAL